VQLTGTGQGADGDVLDVVPCVDPALPVEVRLDAVGVVRAAAVLLQRRRPDHLVVHDGAGEAVEEVAGAVDVLPVDPSDVDALLGEAAAGHPLS